MPQREEREKDRNKEEKEYLHTAEDPARLPTKRANPPGPFVDKDPREFR